jgi:hypothetical protein
MATNERVVGVKIVFDGGDSVKEVEKLEESLKGVNNETEKLNENAKELTGIEKEFEDLNKKVSKGGMSLREMSKAMKEYRDIALKAGETSPIRQEAINMAAQLKDDIRGLGEEISRTKDGAANMQAALQLGGGIIAGYTAFQSVTAALGVENEDLQKTMVKLQAANSALMAVEQLRSSLEKESFLMIKAKSLWTDILSAKTIVYNTIVGTTTGLLKGLRIAFALTGIGAIVLGIGALIMNFDKLGGWIDSAIEKFKNLGIGIKILLAPIYALIAAYEFFFGEVNTGLDEMNAKRAKANEEETAAHKKKIAQFEAERKLQEEMLAELEAKSERQKEINDLEILQARARGASETEIFNITKRQNEENLKLAAEELAAKMKIIEINHQIAEAEYNRWKLFLETQATMSGWTEEQVKKDLQRLEDAKAKYLEDEKNQIDSAQRTFDTIEAENKIFLQDRNKQISDANAKKLEDEKKHLEEMKKLQDQYNEELKIQQIKNIEDENSRRQQELIHRQAMEIKAIRDKYGVGTELEKELVKTHNAEILALEEEFYQAEMDAYEASVDAENALKEANAARDKEEFEAKIAEAEGYIAKAQMALDVMESVNALLNDIAEDKKAKNEEERDSELSALESQKKKELNVAGLTAQQKAQIEYNFAVQEYNIKKKTAEANDKIAERQFKRNKALQLAQASIDTASAVLKAIAMFGPPPSPMGIAAMLAAGIIGGVQIAQIARTNFQGEAASISPPEFNIPSVGGGEGNNNSGSGNGGTGIDANTTLTAPLLQPPLEVSIVEIQKVGKNVDKISEIGTL